ncbi:hypothetical protein AAC387_Pa02g0912 [Persea americana]
MREHPRRLPQHAWYFESNENDDTAGALLAVGIVTCGKKSENEPALALPRDYINKENNEIRMGAIMGLGLAYAGSQNEQIRTLLSPILVDPKAPLKVLAFTAISLGLVFVGSCNEEVAQSIVRSIMMDQSETKIRNSLIQFLPLGLGLLFLRKKEAVKKTMENSKAFPENIRKCCCLTLQSLAYAGLVQKFLRKCAQLPEEGDIHQGPAVMGIAPVAMAEELVPLGLALLCISDPKVDVMDTLSRVSRDTDLDVALALTMPGLHTCFETCPVFTTTNQSTSSL